MGPVIGIGATPEAVAVTGNENEIYGHFTCDDEAEQLQWTVRIRRFLSFR
jgi:hypothetical protein